MMSPTMLVMLAMLLAPIAALVVRSFWTQNGSRSTDVHAAQLLRRWLNCRTRLPIGGHSVPVRQSGLCHPACVKSILMSLARDGLRHPARPIRWPISWPSACKRHKILWLILITVPFWTSYLLRVFAWKMMLGFNGVINSGLISLGLIDQPLDFLLYNPIGGRCSRWPMPGRLRHPADLCQPREDRPLAAGSGDRSRRQAVGALPAHHPAAVGAGHHRDRLAGVHPDGG